MRLTIQVLASAVIVAAVLWGMWRMPRRGETLFGWAPSLALTSAWVGLLAMATSALLWVLPYPDQWVSLVFLLFDPVAIAAGVVVLWIYRGQAKTEPTVESQCVQAKAGIVLGIIAVAVGYIYVMTTKAPGTPVGV